MRKMKNTDDWLALLDTNEDGRKALTLQKAFVIAAEGGTSRWFITTLAMKWAIGRETRDHHRFHVLGDDGEPITFHQREDAAEFLRGLLWLSLPGDLNRRRAKRPKLELALQWLNAVVRSWCAPRVSAREAQASNSGKASSSTAFDL
jgi:hypothetical protein